jgi:signal transduction histidine kinase
MGRPARAGMLDRIAVALALWLTLVTVAAAQPAAFDAAKLDGSVDLASRAELLRDETHALSLADVTTGAAALRFEPSSGPVALGLDAASLWLRFTAQSTAEDTRRVLIELAYPHLDDLQLFVLHEDGRIDTQVAGDSRPFHDRPIGVTNFVFPVDVQGGEQLRVYLRCTTTGTLTVPLTAWEPAAYLEHLRIESIAQWLFCGAILMMALYNLAVFTLIRRLEYLTQSLLLVCMCAVTLASRGDMFALLLPDSPALANKGIPVCLMLCLSAWALTSARVAAGVPAHTWLARPFDAAAVVAGSASLIIALIPKELGLRLGLGLMVLSIASGVPLLTLPSLRPPREVRLYVYSWAFPGVGVGITLLANLGYLPGHTLLLNAAYLGCVLQAVLTSLGLAARVKVMGDHLTVLNGELSQNVVRLEHALEDARLANTLAQQATRAKDEFLATMSHELRTPLNAIINVPQGLLDDFVDQHTAGCQRCNSQFLLEPGEQIGPDTACPECGALSVLSPGERVAYHGDPARTARFLRKIERAGQHLLELVDRVLDFSKMEAGRFEVTREPADLGALIRDAAEAMSGAAAQRNIELAVDLPEGGLPRSLDRVRFRQVLLNLLSNALKFTEDGGRVSVQLTVDDAQAADLVTVSDSGIGIAPEDHERIFLGFEQVHRKKHQRYGGTGLGLPISRNLIRLHGGDLWVESVLGHGSRFVVRLPRVAPQAGTADPTRPLAVTRRSRPPAPRTAV